MVVINRGSMSLENYFKSSSMLKGFRKAGPWCKIATTHGAKAKACVLDIYAFPVRIDTHLTILFGSTILFDQLCIKRFESGGYRDSDKDKLTMINRCQPTLLEFC